MKSLLDCAEEDYTQIAEGLVRWAKGKPVVLLLEGEMGAGKSTFARALLAALGLQQGFQGSPTFAITHTYPIGSGGRSVTHTDLYRIRHEGELEQTGVEELIWSDTTEWALVEWSSLFPDFTSQIHNRLSRRKKVCEVEIRFNSSGKRDVLIREFGT